MEVAVALMVKDAMAMAEFRRMLLRIRNLREWQREIRPWVTCSCTKTRTYGG